MSKALFGLFLGIVIGLIIFLFVFVLPASTPQPDIVLEGRVTSVQPVISRGWGTSYTTIITLDSNVTFVVRGVNHYIISGQRYSFMIQREYGGEADILISKEILEK